MDELVDGKAVGKWEGLKNLVTVSLRYGGEPEVTLRHEAIHALREMRLIDDTEWAVLERAVRGSDLLRQVEADPYYGKQPKAVQIEEAIAQFFAEFQQGKAMLPRYRRIFAKVRDFLTRFGNALRGMGFTSAESTRFSLRYTHDAVTIGSSDTF